VRKIRCGGNYASKYGMYMQGSPAEIRTPAHWPKVISAGTRSAATWPPRRLFYRPTIFFRHPRLTALSCPYEKIRRGFQNVVSFF